MSDMMTSTGSSSSNTLNILPSSITSTPSVVIEKDVSTSTQKRRSASPLKRNIVKKKKIKTEVERLLFSPFRTVVHETLPHNTLIPAPVQKKQADDEQENQVREWLVCNEEGIRPVRAAAIAAAKKGQLGVINDRPKKIKSTPAPRIRPPASRNEKVPKGRSRRIVLKKGAKPMPIRDQPNDGTMTFHNARIFKDTLFQIGDVVSMYDRTTGSGPYYLQVRHLVTDEYFCECVGMRWLVPVTQTVLSRPFQLKNFKLGRSETEVKRFLKDVSLVAHCHIDYFDEDKNKRLEYERAFKGSIYLREDQSKDIMQSEMANIPKVGEQNDVISTKNTQRERKPIVEPETADKEDEVEKTLEDEVETDVDDIQVFKRPDSALIPWMSASTSKQDSETFTLIDKHKDTAQKGIEPGANTLQNMLIAFLRAQVDQQESTNLMKMMKRRDEKPGLKTTDQKDSAAGEGTVESPVKNASDRLLNSTGRKAGELASKKLVQKSARKRLDSSTKGLEIRVTMPGKEATDNRLDFGGPLVAGIPSTKSVERSSEKCFNSTAKGATTETPTQNSFTMISNSADYEVHGDDEWVEDLEELKPADRILQMFNMKSKALQFSIKN